MEELRICEFDRAEFMDTYGFDLVTAEQVDPDTIEEDDIDSYSEITDTNAGLNLTLRIPVATAEEKRKMYNDQIVRLNEEITKVSGNYRDLIDRLKASIEILE